MKKLIYIIEDDEDILTILNIFFKTKGYKVIADYNGNKFKMHEGPCPDVYLIDINLKDKNGFDICKKIKKECNHTHVVLMSANIYLEKMALDCNADAFIHKPFDLENLFEIVDGVTV